MKKRNVSENEFLIPSTLMISMTLTRYVDLKRETYAEIQSRKMVLVNMFIYLMGE